MRLGSYRSVYELVARYVSDRKSRSRPFVPPATHRRQSFYYYFDLRLDHFARAALGGAFCNGRYGPARQGLVRLIEGQGGRVHATAQVDAINSAQPRRRRRATTTGEEIAADVVVSNVDSAWTYRASPARSTRVSAGAAGTSTARVLDEPVCLVFWHAAPLRECRPPHYPARATLSRAAGGYFQTQTLAEDFSLYLHRPTATDSSLAPPGCDAFYVLSPVPNLQGGVDWNIAAEPYRRAIAQRLVRTLLPGFDVPNSNLATADTVGLPKSAAVFSGRRFCHGADIAQSAWFRPHNRSEDIEGLYLVGAGTHPGAGVPGVLSSATIVDRVVPDACALV